jgi:hypothetical protein
MHARERRQRPDSRRTSAVSPFPSTFRVHVRIVRQSFAKCRTRKQRWRITRRNRSVKTNALGFLTLALWGLIAVLAGGFILRFIEKKDWLAIGIMSIGFVWFLWSNANDDSPK